MKNLVKVIQFEVFWRQ